MAVFVVCLCVLVMYLSVCPNLFFLRQQQSLVAELIIL